ncbi:MAG: hypothetical protein JXJ19_03720 [Elusimicrobia bacterium]|nr:hypothetical protein [Elusimicrobiota bacterium]
MFGLIQAGHAYYSAYDSHFMRVDARDAYNRPVESAPVFEESAFSDAYSAAAPLGPGRWSRPLADDDTMIYHNSFFKVPFIAVPFLYSSRSSYPRFTEKHVCNTAFQKTGYLLFMLALVLIYDPNPRSDKEPRFRVPVFLE